MRIRIRNKDNDKERKYDLYLKHNRRNAKSIDKFIVSLDKEYFKEVTSDNLYETLGQIYNDVKERTEAIIKEQPKEVRLKYEEDFNKIYLALADELRKLIKMAE